MTPEQKQLAIHFFNEAGESYLTLGYLYDQMEQLRKENENLKRTNRSLAMRLRNLGDELNE